MRKAILAASLLAAGSLGAIGCDYESVPHNGSCEAFSVSGDQIHPVSYPLGKITVRYLGTSAFGSQIDVSAEVKQNPQTHDFYIDLSQMPTVTDLKDNTWPTDKHVAFELYTDELKVGFTRDCINYDATNEYGIPAVRLSLPTEQPQPR